MNKMWDLLLREKVVILQCKLSQSDGRLVEGVGGCRSVESSFYGKSGDE